MNASQPREIRSAELVLGSPDLDEDSAFFQALGFALESIYPADDPAVVVLAGHGLRLRLERGADHPPAVLRLRCGPAPGEPPACVAPNGTRSFPSKQLSRGVGESNGWYVRCINGEVRLWVNGEEVSGGSDCQPRSGFLALESQGSPVDFKQIRLRELP